jgi:hypothetical protein
LTNMPKIKHVPNFTFKSHKTNVYMFTDIKCSFPISHSLVQSDGGNLPTAGVTRCCLPRLLDVSSPAAPQRVPGKSTELSIKPYTTFLVHS